PRPGHEDTHADSTNWLGIKDEDVLPSCNRKHVLDWRGWRYKSTSQAISESGPAVRSDTGGARGFARACFQSGRSIADGLACRSLYEEVRDAADLSAGGCFDPITVFCVDAGSNLSFRNHLWHRTRRRLHDHSAHGRGTLRRQSNGPFDGRDLDRGWRSRSDDPDARG